MSETDHQADPAQPVPGPPKTGEPAVDEVSRRVAEVADQPLSDHHDRLSRAHEDLHRALHDQSDQSGDPAEG